MNKTDKAIRGVNVNAPSRSCEAIHGLINVKFTTIVFDSTGILRGKEAIKRKEVKDAPLEGDDVKITAVELTERLPTKIFSAAGSGLEAAKK
jgi:hypothetical protein